MDTGKVKEPLYVCIYVPEFSAQALMRLRPDLAKRPVVILAGIPPLEEVCSANTKATRLGIAPGMTRAELDSFTGIAILRRSEAEERTARAVLLEAAGIFTPRIEVQPVAASAFVMVLDMTGSTLLFGPAAQMVSNLQRRFAALRFYVRLAASANLQTALCLAPAASKAPLILPAGLEKEYLRDIPLSAIHLDAQQAEKLSLWGLQTLGELAVLPEVDLVVRLGQEGKRLRLLACGEHPHLMIPEEPVFTLEEYVAFDWPEERLDSLLFVLGPMLDQLLARAQNRSFALASVTLTFELDGGGEHKRTIKPALPVLQRDILLQLIHLDLQAHPPSAGILSVSIHAEPGDRSKVQFGLFAPQLPEPLRLDVTLSQITALVGEDRVGRARLLDAHRSDSFAMEPFSVTDAPATNAAVVRNSVTLRRCRPPIRLSVQHEGKRLTSFFLHSRQYTVEEAYGPWRKSGEWWSSGVWSCEEWDVRAATKSDDALLCVISYDLLRDQWRLEALYD